ncbi:unnamed protein product [Urochloa humidicola]
MCRSRSLFPVPARLALLPRKEALAPLAVFHAELSLLFSTTQKFMPVRVALEPSVVFYLELLDILAR